MNYEYLFTRNELIKWTGVRHSENILYDHFERTKTYLRIWKCPLIAFFDPVSVLDYHLFRRRRRPRRRRLINYCRISGSLIKASHLLWRYSRLISTSSIPRLIPAGRRRGVVFDIFGEIKRQMAGYKMAGNEGTHVVKTNDPRSSLTYRLREVRHFWKRLYRCSAHLRWLVLGKVCCLAERWTFSAEMRCVEGGGATGCYLVSKLLRS